MVVKLTHFKGRNRNRVSDIHTCQTASHHLVCVIILVFLRLFPQVLASGQVSDRSSLVTHSLLYTTEVSSTCLCVSGHLISQRSCSTVATSEKKPCNYPECSNTKLSSQFKVFILLNREGSRSWMSVFPCHHRTPPPSRRSLSQQLLLSNIPENNNYSLKSTGCLR